MTPRTATILTGLLLGAAFPPSPFGWLALVALVPILYSIGSTPESFVGKKQVGYFYVMMFLYHGITNWWVLSWQENTDPYLMASGAALWIFHPFFLMLPFVALSSIRRRLGLPAFLVAIPFAVSGFEWLHGQTDASYPWLTSGYALVDTPLIQVAEYVGVYGLTFLIAVMNALVVGALLFPSRRRVLVSAAIILVAFWLADGIYLKQEEDRRQANEVTQPVYVMMVQVSSDPWNKWEDPRQQLRLHRSIVDSALSANPDTPVDLVVWPETAIPYMIFEPRFATDGVELRRWVDSSNISLLTGFPDEVIYEKDDAPASARTSTIDPEVRYDVFNAAAVVNRSGELPSFHHKSMLTPFAERLPFADQLSFAMSWIEWGVGISAWGKGLTRVPLSVVGEADTLMHMAPIICIESIYPEVSRDFVTNGADVLCVITNDAWYNGTWGPTQHYDIARVRAIEQRRYLIRCGMSGVTGIITPSGESQKTPNELDPEERGVATGSVVTRTHTTFYGAVGDVVPPIGLVSTFVLLILARIPAVVRNMQIRL